MFESRVAREELFDLFIQKLLETDFTEELLEGVADVYAVMGRHPEDTKVPVLSRV